MIHTTESQKTQLDSFDQACKQAGLKQTYQRQVIFQELVKTPDHPSAELLYQRIRKKIPTISLDTVYRTLTTFEKHGLVKRVDTVESQAHFEAAGMSHHHVICNQCGKILDFQWSELDSTALPDTLSRWGTVQSTSITIYGICNECVNNKDEQIKTQEETPHGRT